MTVSNLHIRSVTMLCHVNVILNKKANVFTSYLWKQLNGKFPLGAYVPLTMEGNIVVDDVLASCYPDIDHDMSHFGMTPMRWFPKMIELIFGEDSGI